MNQLNKIEARHIQLLNSDQLVRLLDVLLQSEARTRLLAKHGIHVPFQITVPDGRSDGKWDANIGEYEYIPRSLTYFQCKASNLKDSDCRAEILAKDKKAKGKQTKFELKEKVREVMENAGAYVFFCGQAVVPIDKRIKACRKALKDAGRTTPEKDCIEFLDANRIAAWVNLHVAALSYVNSITTNFQAIGLKSVEAWGGETIFDCDFQLNEYLANNVRALREWLIKPRSVARVTGPSGLGKTRLGYEVFSCKSLEDEKIRKPLHDSTAYVDAQDYGNQVLGWVDQICNLGYNGIVVVDNCSHEWHCRLTQIVTRSNSNISLLTLDYVSETGQPDILHVELDPRKIRDVVPKILKTIPELSHLDDGQIDRVSHFAQGFPQIAILTAKAGRAMTMADLNSDNHLAERLLWGRQGPDQQALEFIKCLSLFSYVGYSGAVKHQLEFLLASLCNGVSEYDFNRLIRPFLKKRIIQSAGDFIMVTPPPLAVALAAEWLADAPDELILGILPGIADHKLTSAFCEQLQKLDFSDRATLLSKRLLGDNAPLSSAEVLNSEVGSRIFRALSELNPLAATQCLYRCFSNYTPKQCEAITDGRRNLIWALEKLCWSEETFHQAATILLLFASGENEKWANNASEQFNQLYHIYLSGTKCPAVNRLEVVKAGLKSSHFEIRKLCISALSEGLEHRHFSRTSGAEARGTKLPEKDWEPKLCSEIWDYWEESFQLLKEAILCDRDLSKYAAEQLGQRVGAFLQNNLVVELENDFKTVAEHLHGYWPEAREQIKDFLSFSKDIPDEPKKAVLRWLSYVQPTDLKSRFLNIVSLPGWEHEKGSNGQFVDKSAEKAELFSEELFKTNIDWQQFIPMLLQGEQRQARYFGAACARLSQDVQALFALCFSVLRSLDKATVNVQFIRGVLSAVVDRRVVESILEQVADDSLLVDYLPQLTTAIRPTVPDFSRVVNQIIAGRLCPSSIHIFAFGSVSTGFDDEAFLGELDRLLKSSPDSAPAMLEVINMHCHLNPDKLKKFYPLLESILLMPSVVIAKRNSMITYYWQQYVTFLLNDSPTEKWIADLTNLFIKVATDRSIMLWINDNIHPLVGLLLSKHTEIAWPIFCEAFSNPKKGDHYALVQLLSNGGSVFCNHGSPIWGLPTSNLKVFAEQYPDLVPGILHFMSLFIVNKSKSGGESFAWHPHAVLLLEYGSLKEVIGCVQANLASFGSSGSRVPYLQARIDLIKSLYNGDNSRFKTIADSLMSVFNDAIDRAKKTDEQHAAGIF